MEDPSELWRFRNSKYVQSSIGPAYREVREYLDAGREVLFSGTPCQCEGLLGCLGGHPAGLTIVDVVCHAVPCRAVFAAYLDWLDARAEDETDTVRFRDKERFGYRCSMMRALSSGDDSASVELYRAGVESDPYLRAFFSDVCDRPSCYSCACATGSPTSRSGISSTCTGWKGHLMTTAG